MNSEIYKNKYIKYQQKTKSIAKLINLVGGNFRPEIANCEKINNFCKSLLTEIKTTNNVDIIESLYTKNIGLFDDKFNRILLSNFVFLLGIKLEHLTNEKLKEILQKVYTDRHYSENPNKLKFIDNSDKIDPSCMVNIEVWNKKFFLEDFWNCTIEEFMNEYDNFETTKQSYLLYWINLVNITSLLCMIKTCNYYFVTVDDDSEERITATNYDEYYNKNEIVIFSDEEDYFKSQNLIANNKKFVFKWIDEIPDKEMFDLIKLLLNCFDCKYENIFDFYKGFVCLLNTKEHPNNFYYGNLLSQEVNELCASIQHNTKYDGFFYLSTNLPRDESYARNEYTKFYCSTINPLYPIDGIVLSINQIVGHDLTFHNMKDRKKKFYLQVKEDFRNLVNVLKDINLNKEHFYHYIKAKYFSQWFREEMNDAIEFINGYERYDYLKMFEYVHLLFHELMSSIPFTNENLATRINETIDGNFFGGVLAWNPTLQLGLIIFIIALAYRHVIYFGNSTEKILKGYCNLFMSDLILKNENSKNINVYKKLYELLHFNYSNDLSFAKDEAHVHAY